MGGAVGRLEGVLRRVEVVVPAGVTRVGAVLVVGVVRAAADAAGVLVGERWEAALKCRSKNTGTLECLLPEEKRMPLSHAT